MTTWIVLFRGINVGGHNVIRMKELSASLESAGFRDVKTYIQSGNVVCRSRHRSAGAVQRLVAKVVLADFNLAIQVLSLSFEQFQEAVVECPFDSDDENCVHFFFLQTSAVDYCKSSLVELTAQSEQWQLINRVFYLHAPDGIGRSRLAGAVEKQLSVTTTARNVNTVRRLVAMCRELP